MSNNYKTNLWPKVSHKHFDTLAWDLVVQKSSMFCIWKGCDVYSSQIATISAEMKLSFFSQMDLFDIVTETPEYLLGLIAVTPSSRQPKSLSSFETRFVANGGITPINVRIRFSYFCLKCQLNYLKYSFNRDTGVLLQSMAPRLYYLYCS